MERFISIWGLIAVASCVALLVYTFGWQETVALFTITGVMFVVMGFAIVVAIVVFYFLTVFRAKYFVRRLREQGYAVTTDKRDIQAFAIDLTIGLIMTPLAIWVAAMAYGKHQFVTSHGFSLGWDWYVIVVAIVSTLFIVGVVALGACVRVWWTSFRPLREEYLRVKSGKETDLPRLPGAG